MNAIAAFFRMMSHESPRPIAYWKMSDGAEFWMTLPAGEEIIIDRLADSLEFPYRLTDISTLQIPSTAPGMDTSCDLQSLLAKINSLPDVVAESDAKGSCINVHFEPHKNFG